MGVTCVKAKLGTIDSGDCGTLSLEGVTPGHTILAGWIGATATRVAEQAVCDGVEMLWLLRALSGDNAFCADVFALEGVQTAEGAVTFTLNAAGAGDVFVFALTPSVLLEATECFNEAATAHACAKPNTIDTPTGAFLLSLIVQDVGARVFAPAPGFTPYALTASSHLLQTRETTEALTDERAIASTNAPTDSEGLLLVFGSDAPEPPDPTPSGGPPRIFGSPVFGG